MPPAKGTYGKLKSGKRLTVRLTASDAKELKEAMTVLGVGENEAIRRAVRLLRGFCAFVRYMFQLREK